MQVRQEINIVSHVVDHIKYCRKIFPFTHMKEGIPPKIWNIIRTSNYFKLLTGAGIAPVWIFTYGCVFD